METKFKITIPKPCHEDWNKMNPSSKGRFCNTCTTEVVDFTKMNSEEIKTYLRENSNVCGRFKNEQLDSIIIRVPKQVLFSQVHFHKMFMLALLVSMGTSLFSCQNSNGTKQKIDSVEIIEEEPKITLGIILPPKDSINDIYEKEKTNNPIKTIKKKNNSNEKNKAVENIITKNDTIKQIYEDDAIYGMPGITAYPEYAGGFQKLYKFVKENYIIHKKAIKNNGKIVVSFAVNKTGKLIDFKVKKDIGFETGNELINVLKKTPKWYPAEFEGKKQIFYYDIEMNITNDTIQKLLRKKITSKIDTIELIRITKFDY